MGSAFTCPGATLNSSNVLGSIAGINSSISIANPGISTEAITITSQAAGDVPFTIKGATSQSGDLLDIKNSSGTILGQFTNNGDLYLTRGNSTAGIYLGNNIQGFYNDYTNSQIRVFGTAFAVQTPYSIGWGTPCDTCIWRDSVAGAGVFDFGGNSANSKTGSLNLTNLTASGTVSSALYATATNCSSSASPAVCAAAAAGSVVVAAAATTVTVNTTAVTANSQILMFYDSSLGTKLGVTCNTTEPALYGVTARVAATSFTLTSSAPITNPACFSYIIIN